MRTRELFTTAMHSLLPKKHKELSMRPFGFAMQYFFLIIILALLVMCVLLIPKIIFLQDTLAERFGNIDSFTIDVHMQTSQPVVIFEHPRAVIDLNKSKVTNEQLLITNTTLYLKQFPFKPFVTDLSQYKDVKAHQEQAQQTTFLLLMLIFPSLLLLFFFISVVKYLVVVLVATIIGFIVTRARATSLPTLSILKIAIFSLSIAVLFDIILFPYLFFWWLGIAAYALLFFTSIIMTADKSYTHAAQFEKGERKRNKK